MVRKISICDISLRSGEHSGNRLPFRVSVEVAKLLSRLGVSVIAASPILDGKRDYFLVKSYASAVKGCGVAVPVDIMDPESPARTWDALKEAEKPRLQVPVPVSTVRMEYVCHRKPAAVLGIISEMVSACTALCPEVEFIAEDFGRSEKEFLQEAISAAVKAGAAVVTLADMAGNLLPEECFALVHDIRGSLPDSIRLGVALSNELFLADACAVAAVRAGADEIVTSAIGESTVSLERFPKILNAKSAECGAQCGVALTELQHVTDGIHRLSEVCTSRIAASAVSDAHDGEVRLNAHDDMAAVLKAVGRLGYDLGEEDGRRVYEAFLKIASGDAVIGAKEMDAIVASAAFQVPSTYHLESFVINTGNVMTPTCHIRLDRDGDILEGVCVGDGPVDAAFRAIDQILGRHFELDDFQIRAVAEGREALGETVVRLRHDGRVYSGRGVSKDIVGSSLMAYLNAINKIEYEEAQS